MVARPSTVFSGENTKFKTIKCIGLCHTEQLKNKPAQMLSLFDFAHTTCYKYLYTHPTHIAYFMYLRNSVGVFEFVRTFRACGLFGTRSRCICTNMYICYMHTAHTRNTLGAFWRDVRTVVRSFSRIAGGHTSTQTNRDSTLNER